jgi:hypothetical protein
MAEDVLVVLKGLLHILRWRKFHEGFSVRTTIAVTNRQVNALLALERLAFLQEVDDVLGRGVPWKSTQFDDVLLFAHVHSTREKAMKHWADWRENKNIARESKKTRRRKFSCEFFEFLSIFRGFFVVEIDGEPMNIGNIDRSSEEIAEIPMNSSDNSKPFSGHILNSFLPRIFDFLASFHCLQFNSTFILQLLRVLTFSSVF